MKPGRTPNQEPSTGGDVYEITIPFHFRSFTAVLQKGAPSANSDSDRHIQSSKKSCSTIVQPWVNLALRSRAIFPYESRGDFFFITKLIPTGSINPSLGWFMQEFSGWPLLEIAPPWYIRATWCRWRQGTNRSFQGAKQKSQETGGKQHRFPSAWIPMKSPKNPSTAVRAASAGNIWRHRQRWMPTEFILLLGVFWLIAVTLSNYVFAMKEVVESHPAQLPKNLAHKSMEVLQHWRSNHWAE